MYCTKCGQENPDNGSFCKKCGNPLTKSVNAPGKINVVEKKQDKTNILKTERPKMAILSEYDKDILRRYLKAVIIYLVVFAVLSVGMFITGKILNKTKTKDENIVLENEGEIVAKTSLDNLNVGDTVIFGEFEQDGNLRNGKEPLMWDVIDEDDGSYLLITHNVIDSRRFDDGLSDKTIKANEDETASFVNWKKSSIREWLNNYFYSTSFNAAERDSILISSIYTDGYAESGYASDNNGDTSNKGGVGGGRTSDKVFLLSYDEFVNYYFMHATGYNMYCPKGITSPTRYAIDQGVKGYDIGSLYAFTPEYTSYVFEAADSEWNLFKQYISPDHLEGRVLSGWMLRSPGSYSNGESVMVVVARGDGVNPDLSVYSEGGVRPAMWVRK